MHAKTMEKQQEQRELTFWRRRQEGFRGFFRNDCLSFVYKFQFCLRLLPLVIQPEYSEE